MSILIRGMEMPKEDEEIIIRIDSSGTVMTEYALPISWAKAVPVPPHGRLIDADVVTNASMEDILMWEDAGCDRDDYRAFLANYIEDAHTIIPAEEGE